MEITQSGEDAWNVLKLNQNKGNKPICTGNNTGCHLKDRKDKKDHFSQGTLGPHPDRKILLDFGKWLSPPGTLHK